MEIIHWGEIEYSLAQTKQLQLVEEVAAGSRPECIVFCSHPAVVTLGRGTQAEDTFGWKGSVIESTRGGRATYHGPNQMVIYPILNLTLEHKNFSPRDIHAYLRALEKAAVLSLAEFGLQAEAKTLAPGPDQPSLTGVWVGDKKVASIGIAVKKWVTYHGIAINLFHDADAFAGINPCGFSTQTMTSIEMLLGKKIERSRFEKICEQAFTACLS